MQIVPVFGLHSVENTILRGINVITSGIVSKVGHDLIDGVSSYFGHRHLIDGGANECHEWHLGWLNVCCLVVPFGGEC